jgi:hypothetical protein
MPYAYVLWLRIAVQFLYFIQSPQEGEWLQHTFCILWTWIRSRRNCAGSECLHWLHNLASGKLILWPHWYPNTRPPGLQLSASTTTLHVPPKRQSWKECYAGCWRGVTCLRGGGPSEPRRIAAALRFGVPEVDRAHCTEFRAAIDFCATVIRLRPPGPVQAGPFWRRQRQPSDSINSSYLVSLEPDNNRRLRRHLQQPDLTLPQSASSHDNGPSFTPIAS